MASDHAEADSSSGAAGAAEVAATPLRNPFKSEQDAFRLLMLIGGAVLLIVVAAAVGGPWVGVPVAVVLLAIATRATWRWLKQSLEEPDEG